MTRIVMALLLALAGCTAPAVAETDPSLSSLRKVDDLPLYEMTYVGDYDEMARLGQAAPPSPFGCSLFAAAGLFARNFDWEPNAALVLRTAPPDGYAAISIVDISYLGVPSDTDLSADAAARRKLLDAPLLPFDGMNERGLAVGMAADESGRTAADPAKPTVGSVRIMRLILDRAATVEEALKVLEGFNLDFSGGPPLHYLFADRSGASAVVEFVDGQRRVERGGPPWQALTNFQIVGASEPARQADHRYAVASQALQRQAAGLDWRQAMGVLQAVAQQHTRWSVVYDLRSGAVHVVTGKRWHSVHDFALPMKS
jgi:hypothetical protein